MNDLEITSGETISKSYPFEKNSLVEQNPQKVNVRVIAILLKKVEEPVLTTYIYL